MALRHREHRVLYVPLDNRPCNTKTPRLLAQMVDYDLMLPPTEMLGSFRDPGQPEEIAGWLRSHTDPAPDCIILSLDMLAYGGLWASRAATTRTRLALDRLAILPELRKACPEATIYGFSVILRLGTVASSDEAATYLDSLLRYSVLAGRTQEKPTAEDQAALKALERAIPPAILGEYMAVRGRNQEVYERGLRAVSDGALDFMVFGQDVADSDGVHRQEQAEIITASEELGVDDRIVVLPGADELGMCLLTRFVHYHMGKVPVVRVVTSAEPEEDVGPPGEDRPFGVSLADHIKLVGATEAGADDPDPDMVLAVNWPMPWPREALQDAEVARDHRDKARESVGRALAASQARGLAVCDAAFGDGADDIFVQELVSATENLAHLLSYAGSGTASTGLGAALSHGALRLIALQDKGAFDLAQVVGDMSPMRYLGLLDALISSEKAHVRHLLARFADDWLYQARVRPRVLEHVCQGLRSGLFDLSRSHQQAEAMIRDELTQALTDLWIDQFLGRQCVPLGLEISEEDQPDAAEGYASALVLADLEETRITLPWRRLYEVDLELEFGVELVAAK